MEYSYESKVKILQKYHQQEEVLSPYARSKFTFDTATGIDNREASVCAVQVH